MDIEKFNEAKILVGKLTNLDKIISDHDLGWNDGNDEFVENSSDFYNGTFFNVKNVTQIHKTGGGYSDVPRVKITEYCDGSGASYVLDKQETIQYQKFIENLIEAKRLKLKTEINDI